MSNADLAKKTDVALETVIAIPAVVKVASAIQAEGTSNKLSDKSFSMVRCDLSNAATDALIAVLDSVYQ